MIVTKLDVEQMCREEGTFFSFWHKKDKIF